jgi:hypothetical protein
MLSRSPNLRPLFPKSSTFNFFYIHCLTAVSPNPRPFYPKSSTFRCYFTFKYIMLRTLLTVVKIKRTTTTRPKSSTFRPTKGAANLLLFFFRNLRRAQRQTANPSGLIGPRGEPVKPAPSVSQRTRFRIRRKVRNIAPRPKLSTRSQRFARCLTDVSPRRPH